MSVGIFSRRVDLIEEIRRLQTKLEAGRLAFETLAEKHGHLKAELEQAQAKCAEMLQQSPEAWMVWRDVEYESREFFLSEKAADFNASLGMCNTHIVPLYARTKDNPDQTAFIDQKLAEAQAETVERCLEAKPIYFFAGSNQPSPPSVGVIDWERAIRNLSPDPHAKERWELEARLMEQRVYGYHDPVTHTLDRERTAEIECPTCQRLADLERQLVALTQGRTARPQKGAT